MMETEAALKPPWENKSLSSQLPIHLERSIFLESLIHHLAAVLQDVVGVAEANGFLQVVGQRLGDEINHLYCVALQVKSLSRENVSRVLIDLNFRVQADFSVIEDNEDRLVLVGRKCLLIGEKSSVSNLPGQLALSSLTASVLGTLIAQNLGYAKVHVEQGRGQGTYRVVIYLRPTLQAQKAEGLEFFKGL